MSVALLMIEGSLSSLFKNYKHQQKKHDWTHKQTPPFEPVASNQRTTWR